MTDIAERLRSRTAGMGVRRAEDYDTTLSVTDVLEAADEIERLRVKCDALRAALMPFAVAADPDLAPETDDKWVDTSNYMLRDLTYGYFRKARNLLSEDRA
jgi:hypothetical protein